MKNFRLIESRLLHFLSDFENNFTFLTRSVCLTAQVYLKGLLLCRRRNCQVMAEELQQSNQQRLHHFITGSRWCFQQLMDTVTARFYELLKKSGLSDDVCLIIDESGNPKRQTFGGFETTICGQTGKLDNCQVGVFGALCAGSLVNLVQAKLFGGENAGSKIDQAKALINAVCQQLKGGVKWVCFDAFYGRDAALLCSMIKDRIDFIADVPEKQHIWLEPFQMRVPPHKGTRGRKPQYTRTTKASMSVKNIR